MINDAIACGYLYIISKYGYPPPAEHTLKHLAEFREMGFRSIELEGIHEAHLKAVYAQRAEIKSALIEHDLQVPYFCVVLPGLSSPDAAVRDANLGLFELGCELAADLDAKGVLDNGPLPPYQFPDGLPIVRHYEEDVLRAARLPSDLDWPRYWDALVDTYSTACDIAATRNLTYQIHPCMGVLTSTTDGFLQLYDAVKRDNLRFNFDVANLFVMKENLTLSLRRLAGLMDYIHLSDNNGRRVEHLMPGDGAIEWDPFFETLAVIGFQGHIGLDIGGAESGVADLPAAYAKAAQWLEGRWR